MAMAPSMRMKERLSGNTISTALTVIMMANLIGMKDGMRADGLIAPKTVGIVGKINSIAGKTVGTAGKIVGTAVRINGIVAKIDGIVKKMSASSKEIGVITEGMYPAVMAGPGAANSYAAAGPALL